MWVTWYDANQYELYSVSMREYTMEMIEVVMRLKHSSDSQYKPVTIVMRMDDSGDHILRSYSSNFPFHRAAELVAEELTDECEEFARDLIRGLER